MTTSTRRRHPIGSPRGAARQVTWTRLGNGMGYTNTQAKRSEIRAAVEAIAWREPDELVDVLDAPPARQVIGFVLGGRRWALHRAAVTTLPSVDRFRGKRRLLAVESVSGERFVLLDDTGYEWIHVSTDRPGRIVEAASSTVDGQQ